MSMNKIISISDAVSAEARVNSNAIEKMKKKQMKKRLMKEE